MEPGVDLVALVAQVHRAEALVEPLVAAFSETQLASWFETEYRAIRKLRLAFPR